MFTKAILEELLVYRYQYGKDLSRNSVEAELMVFQTFYLLQEESSIIPI